MEFCTWHFFNATHKSTNITIFRHRLIATVFCTNTKGVICMEMPEFKVFKKLVKYWRFDMVADVTYNPKASVGLLDE